MVQVREARWPWRWPRPAGAGGPGAGRAQASDEWCDTDPLLLVITPQGNIVPVFYMTGVKLPLHLGLALLGLLTDALHGRPGPGRGDAGRPSA